MGEIRLPNLGDGIKQATLAYWHCQVGDAVTKDDDVAEVVTDKATFNIPAGSEGVITEICVQVGDQINVGSVIAMMEP
jgi:pyruvate/2-oxoglutarate dehydrogenase complex dihydrolipoamide acyltransferase (E2) component